MTTSDQPPRTSQSASVSTRFSFAESEVSFGIPRARPAGTVSPPWLHRVPEDLDLSHTLPVSSRRRARVFAHRGASGLFPEHTRAAYTRALEESADGLEIDVHLSRDGEVVCFHDPTVDRTSDGTGAVAELSLTELRKLDVSSWKTPRLPGEYGSRRAQMMTLQDVLELLGDAGRDVSLAIELKHPSAFGHQLEERVLQILLSFGWDPESSVLRTGSAGGHHVEVSFMSFYAGSLMHLAEMVPPERLCALFCTVAPEQIEEKLRRTWLSAAMRPVFGAIMRSGARDAQALVWTARAGIAGPSVEWAVRHRAEIKAWIARGAVLRVWTVDEPEDAAMLLDLGVGEMTTNYPARVITAVSG